jgi:glycyl-tRNA synthetase
LNEWIDGSWNWLKSIGLREELMHKSVHSGDKLAHYARACTDITFTFPFGTQELMGIAARGNFDLTQHSSHSGKALEYFDAVTNVKYIPHVIEPSLGVDRLFLALLTSAYREEMVEGEKRTVLGFHPAIAPIKVVVLPLVNNKPELTEKAKDLFSKLQNRYMCEWDTSGAIGRRYRRADEAGTPFCVTIDFDTLTDDSVTIRSRDSMQQQRLKIPDLFAYLSNEIDGI